MIVRAFTGELGTWRRLMPNAGPVKAKLRPPPWSRLKQADVERMEQARAAARAAVEQ